MKRQPFLLLIIGLLLSIAAAPPRQDDATPLADEPTAEATAPFAPPVWVSPTPDETGAIVVIVQSGDSMWVIAARAGISLPELLAFNNLTENSIISPGDALIVGYATPEFTAPEEITPTATLPPPTPQLTATPSVTAVCLSAFDDPNRNGIHDAGEPLRAGVAFTIYNTQAVVANYITDGRSEPKCLGGLLPGEYRITRSVTPGEILTTEGDWRLNLTAGSELRQAFGSFIDDAPAPSPAAQGGQETAAQATSAPPLPGPPSASQPSAPSGDGFPGLRLAGVIALFLGGLLLLGAVLILLGRQSPTGPGAAGPEDAGSERRFRNIDDLE